MDSSLLTRELNVGFSGGEKKKVEMLQLLLLQPKLAILDETDSGLDVDALSVVSRGITAYREQCGGALLIITHNTRILERVDVDRTHVMVRGHLVAEDVPELIGQIDANGFERYEAAEAKLEQARRDGAREQRGRRRHGRRGDIPGESPERRRAEVGDVDRSMYDFVKPRAATSASPTACPATSCARSVARRTSRTGCSRCACAPSRPTSAWRCPELGPRHRRPGHEHDLHVRGERRQQAESWDDVPDDIKDTFERLGIPEAERTSLAGVGAQYDSEVVYHNMKDEVAKSGVVYTTVEDAMHSATRT